MLGPAYAQVFLAENLWLSDKLIHTGYQMYLIATFSTLVYVLSA